jgi:hypothetical protein
VARLNFGEKACFLVVSVPALFCAASIEPHSTLIYKVQHCLKFIHM